MDERQLQLKGLASVKPRIDTTDCPLPNQNNINFYPSLSNVQRSISLPAKVLMDDSTTKWIKELQIKLADRDEEVSRLEHLLWNRSQERENLHIKLMRQINNFKTSSESKPASPHTTLNNEPSELQMLFTEELNEIIGLTEQQHEELTRLKGVVIHQKQQIKDLVEQLSNQQLPRTDRSLEDSTTATNVETAERRFNSEEIIRSVIPEQSQDLEDGSEETTRVLCVNNVVFILQDGVCRTERTTQDDRLKLALSGRASNYAFEESSQSTVLPLKSEWSVAPRSNRSDSDEDLYSSNRTFVPSISNPEMPEDYICPLCSRIFPKSRPRAEFEQHVDSHFI